MTLWRYVAIPLDQESGQRAVSGLLSAASPMEAGASLRRIGLQPLRLKRAFKVRNGDAGQGAPESRLLWGTCQSRCGSLAPDSADGEAGRADRLARHNVAGRAAAPGGTSHRVPIHSVPLVAAITREHERGSGGRCVAGSSDGGRTQTGTTMSSARWLPRRRPAAN
jgi:hypothetical protein